MTPARGLAGLILLALLLSSRAIYWLLLREVWRKRWRAGDITWGEFLLGLQKAPRWLVRSTK